MINPVFSISDFSAAEIDASNPRVFAFLDEFPEQKRHAAEIMEF